MLKRGYFCLTVSLTVWGVFFLSFSFYLLTLYLLSKEVCYTSNVAFCKARATSLNKTYHEDVLWLNKAHIMTLGCEYQRNAGAGLGLEMNPYCVIMV